MNARKLETQKEKSKTRDTFNPWRADIILGSLLDYVFKDLFTF
jgi:hypothetical protein